MSLIQRLKEKSELKKEEKLFLREVAQERVNKKRAEQAKRQEFEKMLKMRLPCKYIIKLRTNYYLLDEFNYYLMDTMPLTILLLMQEGVRDIPCTFKQLTGIGAGDIYKGRYNPNLEDNGVHVYLNPLDRSKLTVSINGYRNGEIEQHFAEKTQLEKHYGKTITIEQLLVLWKQDNAKAEIINFETDYDMVKRVYDSEDILSKENNKELTE